MPAVGRASVTVQDELSDGRPRRVTTLPRRCMHGRLLPRSNAGVYASTSASALLRIGAQGETPARTIGAAWRPYSSVGAPQAGLLPSGQLTGVIVVLADSDVRDALVVVAHPDDVDFWAGGTVASWTDAGTAVT
jgi:hypothetical protein